MNSESYKSLAIQKFPTIGIPNSNIFYEHKWEACPPPAESQNRLLYYEEIVICGTCRRAGGSNQNTHSGHMTMLYMYVQKFH